MSSDDKLCLLAYPRQDRGKGVRKRQLPRWAAIYALVSRTMFAVGRDIRHAALGPIRQLCDPRRDKMVDMIRYRPICHSFVPGPNVSSPFSVVSENVHMTIGSANVDVQGFEISSQA